jgi:hypothetical protein
MSFARPRTDESRTRSWLPCGLPCATEEPARATASENESEEMRIVQRRRRVSDFEQSKTWMDGGENEGISSQRSPFYVSSFGRWGGQ